MKKTLALMIVGPLALLGCSDSDAPTAAHEEDEGLSEVHADLTFSEDHIHTLDEISLTALLTDHHGEAITNVDSVWVQRRLEGDDTWRSIALTFENGVYSGAYTFATSGEYDIRVVGKNAGDEHEAVLYEAAEHMGVGRAHEVVAGYRVEFESFPGHIHEGNTATLRFWVLESDRNDSGERPAIAGLAAEIHCNEADGTAESHDNVEVEGGYYEANHTFVNSGGAHAELHFPGQEGTEGAAEFHFDIAHGH